MIIIIIIIIIITCLVSARLPRSSSFSMMGRPARPVVGCLGA
jgi:hypothetical protein